MLEPHRKAIAYSHNALEKTTIEICIID